MSDRLQRIETINAHVSVASATSLFPALMSLEPGIFLSEGLFFSTIKLLEGEPGSINTTLPVCVTMDTGAKDSIISTGVAAQLKVSEPQGGSRAR
ncbi:MAG: hypothetical protein IIC02_05435 [Planctomycetes bacterium]|nr:hypothetical protein [Planctomycetota bacterium]